MALRVWLRLAPPVLDVLLAAALAWFSVRGTLQVAPADAAERLAAHGNAGYLLLVAGSSVLALRRRFPLSVLVACAGLSITYYALGYPDGPGWLPLFVAAYTVTSLGDGRRSVSIVTGVLVALAVAWLATADLSPLSGAGWVFFRIGGLALAVAVGESLRARQQLADEALRRAEAAERGREDEAQRRADAERLRIAREVHDTVAHAITVINVHAGSAAHVLSRRPDQAAAALRTIAETSARALAELRSTLHLLDDAGADGGNDGRRPASGIGEIGELVARARDAGLPVDVAVDVPSAEAQRLPHAVEHAVYRVVQESLTNVLRHAGTVPVTVAVTGTGGALDVVVADAGPGGAAVAASAATGAGRGLAGMRQRCELLGGSLTAGPADGGGFVVRAHLPVATEAGTGS